MDNEKRVITDRCRDNCTHLEPRIRMDTRIEIFTFLHVKWIESLPESNEGRLNRPTVTSPAYCQLSARSAPRSTNLPCSPRRLYRQNKSIRYRPRAQFAHDKSYSVTQLFYAKISRRYRYFTSI